MATCRHCEKQFAAPATARWCSTECRLLGASVQNGNCLEWRQSTTRRGYGRVRHAGTRPQAHRLAYKLFVGDPGTLHVLHRCDNRRCIRPDHLFLGTQQENIADMIAKGRQAKGESRPQAKLTSAEAKAIADSKERGVDLATRYNVSPQTICDIRKGRGWAHL